jgi:hypothetical protein
MLPLMHFSPHTSSPRACWHCTHFLALVYGATADRCLRAGRLSIQAAPTTGCVFWEREVGADDEPGPPASGEAASRPIALDLSIEVAWAP